MTARNGNYNTLIFNNIQDFHNHFIEEIGDGVGGEV